MEKPKKTQTANLTIRIRRKRVKNSINKRMKKKKSKKRSPKGKTNWLSRLENPQKSQKLSMSGLINTLKDLLMKLKSLQPKSKLLKKKRLLKRRQLKNKQLKRMENLHRKILKKENREMEINQIANRQPNPRNSLKTSNRKNRSITIKTTTIITTRTIIIGTTTIVK